MNLKSLYDVMIFENFLSIFNKILNKSRIHPCKNNNHPFEIYTRLH
jgi:hypothetical protein